MFYHTLPFTVFLYDTLMMVAEATEKVGEYRYMTENFIDVHIWCSCERASLIWNDASDQLDATIMID